MSSAALSALCWIRRDLRLDDHAALALATSLVGKVAVVFVFDRVILDALEDRDDRRVTFIHRSLQELDAKLQALGSRLIVLHGDPVVEIPALAQRLGVRGVVAARDYEPYAKTRDAAVEAALKEAGVGFKTVKDSVVMEAGEVLTQSGGVYRVYSPYARMWRANMAPERDAAEHRPDTSKLWPAAELDGVGAPWSMADLGFVEADLWLEPGEDAGAARLAAFAAKAARYGDTRDFPAADGTSGLSVHLRFGTVGVRQCVRLALGLASKGADKWLSEIIWRDFYQDLLAHHPHVVETTFQPQYAGLEYPGTEEHFQAWCEGRTGYPIVDAAMRCLNATGWMHNRLRMVVASFLTKDLLVDYRRGEAYFARKLLDFDLASNNGGWQWAASVGADPQPYFRIFNPVLQSERFDPEGRFLRQWLPELAKLDGAEIHWPHGSPMVCALHDIELGRDYPHPIVDHHVQKELAIRMLEKAKNAAATV